MPCFKAHIYPNAVSAFLAYMAIQANPLNHSFKRTVPKMRPNIRPVNENIVVDDFTANLNPDDEHYTHRPTSSSIVLYHRYGI